MTDYKARDRAAAVMAQTNREYIRLVQENASKAERLAALRAACAADEEYARLANLCE